MPKPNYTEEQIKQIKEEYLKQTEILNKYWRVLVKKGLSIAKESGLETIVIQGGEGEIHLDTSSDITIYRDGDKADAEQIIVLTKYVYPGIYNNYIQRRTKHKELEIQLKEIKEYLKQQLEHSHEDL